MNILDQIMARKRVEVAERKAAVSAEALRQSPLFGRAVNSAREAILSPGSTGIIAEFKRQSPSKGVINGTADVVAVSSV